jgi:branched-chain amino acid transport system substrate-binding protein
MKKICVKFKILPLMFIFLNLVALKSAVCEVKPDEKITIGVQTPLTGESATFGTDIKNALLFANERYFNNKYQFIFEDDFCTAKGGIDAAQKLISVDKVKYVLGLGCNEPLLAAAPLYQRNKVIAISATATTGDVLDVGDHIFRMFPADQIGAEVLYKYIAAHHKKVAIITEQNEYPLLLDRTFTKLNRLSPKPLDLISDSFLSKEYDHRTALIKIKQQDPDAIFINANAEGSFIELVKQIKELGIKAQIYGEYWPASKTTLDALGAKADGIIFANIPLIENSLNPEGKQTYQAFVDRFGAPLSISLGVALTIDSLRILDSALASGRPLVEALHDIHFNGLVGTLGFDKHGAIAGVPFELQKIVNGKVALLSE